MCWRKRELVWQKRKIGLDLDQGPHGRILVTPEIRMSQNVVFVAKTVGNDMILLKVKSGFLPFFFTCLERRGVGPASPHSLNG